MNRIRTRRWNDPAEPGDGFRLLVCRYRPRGVRKEDETWNAWRPGLGPSRDLHAAYYGKHGTPLTWPEYRRQYWDEMKEQQAAVDAVAERVASGETVTLLCSSACVDATRCHRTLLAKLIEDRIGRDSSPGPQHASATELAMTMSIHIVYRDFEPTEAIEAYVRRHVEKLEAHVSRIVSCNVAIEAPHRHKHNGRHVRVRIDLVIPGAELVVDRDPEPDRGHEDAYAAIDEAFDRALRRAIEHGKRFRSTTR